MKILILFLISTIMEMAGIGLVGPYIALVLNPGIMGNGVFIEVANLLRVDQVSITFIVGIALVLMFFLKTLLSILINSIVIEFGQSQGSALQVMLMKSYQSMSYLDFIGKNTSEYIYAITTLSGQFTSVLQGLLRACGDLLIITLIVLFLAYKNFLGTSIFIGIACLAIFIYDAFYRARLQKLGEQINLSSTALMSSVREGLLGIKEARVYGLQDYFYNKTCINAKNFSTYNSQYLIIAGMPKLFLELILIIFLVLFISISLRSGLNSTYLFSTLGIFGVAAVRILPSANSFVNNLTLLRYAKDSMFKLYHDVRVVRSIEVSREELLSAERSKAIDDPSFLSLEMKDVSFFYPNSSVPALYKVSLKVQKGELIGIIGKSGSGKTTLINMILGLLSPSDGDIFLNKKSTGSSWHGLGNCVAYLPQDTFLVDGTLKQNIALGIDDALVNVDILNSAIRQARLEDFVAAQPARLETLVGEGGIKISGGQRQRIALARAFYHGRQVLVMDEATSALDMETESEVIEEVKSLKGKVTIILITHRPSTLIDCDLIYRIEDGVINSFISTEKSEG